MSDILQPINHDAIVDMLKNTNPYYVKDEDSESYHTKTMLKKDPRNFNISESLLVGFDNGGDSDIPCLTVVRRKKDKLEIVNTYHGEAAIQMYNMLLYKPTERYL